jgi:DNA-binding IclR family transcriptional regulator
MNLAPLSSVDNALQTMELLCRTPHVRVLDVAREVGVANSTAHRLLGSLVARRFAERDAVTHRYSAGAALLEIGRTAVLQTELPRRARGTLQRISQTIGETAHLGIREGTAVRYLDAVESTRAVRVAARTGRALEAHWTSTGKVLLAALDDDVIRRLYGSDHLPTVTQSSIGNVDDLLSDLGRCRANGYAVNSGESEEDVVSVAVPIEDGRGVTIAAVSCAGPQHRFPAERAAQVAATMREVVHSTLDYVD